MEKEKQLLILCRQQIEQALKWGDSEAWSNDDFEQLSEKIFEKTKVQLSISTLKRIWGKVRYENFPTTGTLNALAGFLDYGNWREFKQKNEPEAIPPIKDLETALTAPVDNGKPMSLPSGTRVSKMVWIMLFTAALVIILTMTFISRKKEFIKVDPSRVKFESVKVSDSLPNSVIFNYDASAFKSDSVYIQQSWDPTRREKVDGKGKQYTSIYYNPGYFIAKLVVDNQIKKECVVNIQTKGWKGIIQTQPVPVYLSQKEINVNGMMGVSGETLKEKIGSPVFNNVAVTFANVREFRGIDANNFTLETTLRNSSAVEASICRTVNMVILGKGSAIIVPLAEKGCISQIGVLAGMDYISGKDNDLSAFGCDFNNFQNLKLTVKDKHLLIYLNGKQIMDTPEKLSLKEVVGLRFEFEGTGLVKNIKLSSPGGGVYEEEFGH